MHFGGRREGKRCSQRAFVNTEYRADANLVGTFDRGKGALTGAWPRKEGISCRVPWGGSGNRNFSSDEVNIEFRPACYSRTIPSVVR